MEQKKKDSVNLNKNLTLYVLVGINACLLLTWAALNFITKPIQDEPEPEKEIAVVYADEIPVVEVEEVAPPPPPPPDAPPPPPPPPEVITEIEETDTPPPPPPPDPTPPPPKPQAPTNAKVRIPTKTTTPKAPPPKPVVKEDRRSKRVSAREVDIMAVYPGCEKDRDVKKATTAKAKKDALNKCFGNKLRGDLSDQLDIDYLTEEAEDNSEYNMVAKLDFVVDEKGNIIEISPKSGGSETLKPEAVKALRRVAERIQRKGGIVPAKYSDGTDVQMKYSIPVRFKLDQ